MNLEVILSEMTETQDLMELLSLLKEKLAVVFQQVQEIHTLMFQMLLTVAQHLMAVVTEQLTLTI